MFAVTVRFEVEAGEVETFAGHVETQARTSMSDESGCVRFDVWHEPGSTTFFLYELYESEAAFAAHRETAHYADFDRKVAGLVADKAVVTFSRPIAVAAP